MGHGDFVFAQTPQGQSLIIDCGSGDVVPSEFLSKISTIDELQISHPHTDHFTDLPALSGKNIRSFRCPSLVGFDDAEMGWRNSDRNAIAALRQMAGRLSSNDAAVPVGYGFNHTVWEAPGATVDYSDPNTVSYVTTLSYGTFKMLFGGDLPTEGWEAHMKNPAFVRAIAGTTILKVSHHGRDVGTCDELFGPLGISPALCVISDKAIDSSNENTVRVDWYRQRTRGVPFSTRETPPKPLGTRHVLTTRRDGSIHFQANGLGNWRVWTECRWENADWQF